MDETITIVKKQYTAPTFCVTAIRLTDVIMTSPVIERYKETVYDGGDWGDLFDDSLVE